MYVFLLLKIINFEDLAKSSNLCKLLLYFRRQTIIFSMFGVFFKLIIVLENYMILQDRLYNNFENIFNEWKCRKLIVQTTNM